MKRIFTAAFLAVAAIGAGAQNTSVKVWIPHVNGVPVPGVVGNSTQAYCENGNLLRPITEKTLYDCRLVQAVTPPAGVPAPAPAPAPAPSPVGSWVIGPSLALEPTTPRPARGVAAPDPVFKSPVYRVTDIADPPVRIRKNDYSRRQAFNANNSRQLVAAGDGFFHVYSANTFAYEKRLNGPGGDAEIQWHPTNPDLLIYMPSNGLGMKLYELNVATNTTRQIADLGPRLKARWPTAMAAWTGAEGSPSADGRYHCFMVDAPDWVSVGVVVWDSQTDTIVGYHNTNGNRPDHTSMSATGKYCVVSNVGAPGTVAHTRDFSSSKVLHRTSDHSDLGLDANGVDTYVAVDYGSGDVFMVNLDTGVRTALFNTYIGGNASAFHFSLKSFSKPGWVLVSAQGNDPAKTWAWPWRKMFLQELKPGGRVLNIAFHRSTDGYNAAPVPSISRDGTRVAFTSSWMGTTDADINVFQVKLFAY